MWIGKITKDEENTPVSRRLEIEVLSSVPVELRMEERDQQVTSVGTVSASRTAETAFSTGSPAWLWVEMMHGYEPMVLIDYPMDGSDGDYDPTGTTIYVDVSFAFPNPWPGSWQDTSEFMLESGWVPQG